MKMAFQNQPIIKEARDQALCMVLNFLTQIEQIPGISGAEKLRRFANATFDNLMSGKLDS